MVLFQVEEKTDDKNPKNGRIIVISKVAVCNSKKLRFIKDQEATGILSSFGIKTSLMRIPLVGPLLF